MLITNNYNRYMTNFKSNPEREREMRRLRELERLRQIELERQRQIELARQRELERHRQVELERQRELMNEREVEQQRVEQAATERKNLAQDVIARQRQYEIDNELSKSMAGFLSQFTCAIQNNSEHDIQEFFGSEEKAAELREKLSETCQKDSIMLRNELHKFDEINDPVQALICANKMNKFAPKEGILTQEQHTNLVEGLKNTISSIVRNADLSQFELEDKNAILDMIQQIERSDSVDFGIGNKLKILIDRLNKKNLNLGFIPPVEVRDFVKDGTKILAHH